MAIVCSSDFIFLFCSDSVISNFENKSTKTRVYLAKHRISEKKVILKVMEYEQEDEKEEVDKEESILKRLEGKEYFVKLIESFVPVFCFSFFDLRIFICVLE
jgi:serine/threonine protein kinase